LTKICTTCGDRWPDDVKFCPKDGAALRSESPTDLVDQVIADRYHVIRKLGQGGMGAVYLAEHVRMGMKVALKVIVPEMATNADAVARFTREARNAASIKHPNVCSVFDFGETPDGVVYLAMEYIDGQTLTEVLRGEGPLPPQRAAEILQQCGDALQAAHDMGIVHRDFKPDNVMLTRVRGVDVLKVVDFGIAKAASGMSPAGDASGQTLTRAGFVVGTPEFMSPEQAAGQESDPRSDIYALALVLFRMLTGKMPFSGSTPQESLSQRLTERPLRLIDAVPGASFPATLQTVLDRALARDREHRYATVLDFAKEGVTVLRTMAPVAGLGVGDKTSLVPSLETSAEPKRGIRAALRNMRWPARIAALLLTLAAAIAIVVLVPRSDPPRPDTTKIANDSGPRVGATTSVRGVKQASGAASSTATARTSAVKPPPVRRDVPVPIPPLVEKRADIDAAVRDRLQLLVDAKGRYVALDLAARQGSTGLVDALMWFGDAKKLYAQQSSPRDDRADRGDTSATYSFSDQRVPGWSGRVRVQRGSYSLRCADDSAKLTPVPRDAATSLLAKVEFFQPRWQRVLVAIARDNDARYYLVDRAKSPDNTTDFRLFMGKKTALEQVELTDTVSDNEGAVLFAASGKLVIHMRRRGSSYVVNNPEWVEQGRSTELTTIAHAWRFNQSLPGYTDFGLYRKVGFGTPCDGFL